MNDDIALPKAPEGFVPRALDDLSVESLRVYATELEVEAERVKEEIARKSDYKASADAMFRT